MSAPSPENILIRRTENTCFTLRWYPGPAGAPVVLVVPAMGVQAGYYGKLAQAQREAGLSVAVTELRGHEASGGRRPSRRYDFGYADLVQDVGRAVDELRVRAPEAQILLLGHSLGGHVGSVYAAQHPGALAGLMLVATGSVWWRLWDWRMYAIGVLMSLLTALLGYFPGHRLGFAGREARGQMRDWIRFNRTGRLEFGAPRTNHDVMLAALDLPVLAVSFEGDSFAPPKALEGLLAKFHRARITRLHLGAREQEPPGHLRWARRPDLLLGAMTTWIDSSAEHFRTGDHRG
ncbi:alpha/beta fold hydrolase [Pseudactinotalea sp. Z1748]|uniref:alpha/beta hydrolase family protein n=1 Tax=Pseudactinotalea sp. Z1748 TaxID=3413027 RepID=UPI003C7E9FD1